MPPPAEPDGWNAGHQSRLGQRAQDVIHRLVRHRREPGEIDGKLNPAIAGDQIGHPPGSGSSRCCHIWGTTAISSPEGGAMHSLQPLDTRPGMRALTRAEPSVSTHGTGATSPTLPARWRTGTRRGSPGNATERIRRTRAPAGAARRPPPRGPGEPGPPRSRGPTVGGAFGSEGFTAAQHVPDRLRQSPGEIDLGDLGATLLADPRLRLLVAIARDGRGAGVRCCFDERPAQVARALL